MKRIASSNTVLAPHAALNLAEKELRESEFGLSIEESRTKEKERLQRALGWLNLADVPDSPVRAPALLLKGRIALNRSQPAAAKEFFERVLREFPRSASADKAEKLVSALVARTRSQP